MKINPRLAVLGEYGISGFKYLISIYMMLAGVLTPFSTVTASNATLGFLYSSRLSLVIIGTVIFCSGAILFYGKIRRSRRWTGRGLMSVYVCFLFAAILNFVAYGGDWTFWLGNAVAAIITGMLYLRWKFKTEYINPNHFVKDIDSLA